MKRVDFPKQALRAFVSFDRCQALVVDIDTGQALGVFTFDVASESFSWRSHPLVDILYREEREAETARQTRRHVKRNAKRREYRQHEGKNRRRVCADGHISATLKAIFSEHWNHLIIAYA